MGNSSTVSVVVSVPVTALSISVSTPSGPPQLTSLVTGYLTAAGVGVAGKTVSLYYDSTLFFSATTGSDGGYSITMIYPSPGYGTFLLHTNFAGDASYAASTSPTVTETIAQIPTSLSIVVSPTSGPSPLTVNITGTLSVTSTGAGISGETVSLYEGTAVIATSGVNSAGFYSFTVTLTAMGTYNFHTSFSGDFAYAGCEESDHAVVAGPTPPPSPLPWLPIEIGLVTGMAIVGYYLYKHR